MAQAIDHPTPIKDLDDLLRYLTEELRYSKGVAIYSMNQHYHGQLDGRLVLEKQDLIDDEPYGGWVTTNANLWDLKLGGDGHVQVIPRIKLWPKAHHRRAEECDPRAIWPPQPAASQAAPDQQPADRAVTGSSEMSLPASDPPSTQEWATAEAIRLIKANKILAKEKRHISHFAKLLEKAEANKSSIGWRHLKNMLPKWNLWPVESIPSKFPDAFRDA